MGTDIEYDQSIAKAEMVFLPVEKMNRAGIRSIPDYAHVLLVNLRDTGVEFSSSNITPEEKETWINQLGDEDEEFGSTAVFYANPDRVRPVGMPTDRLPTPEEIADARIVENYGDNEGLYEAIENESLDPDGVRAMLIQAVKDARAGMVENPF